MVKPSVNFPFDAVKAKIDAAKTITILTHVNPDADTLGTGLGIFALLNQDKNKRIEIVNASTHLPRHLHFLPYFHKIKSQIEYQDSLIISCDSGSEDRLGFDVEGREIINVDHHVSNSKYGTLNVVVPEYASASQVAFALFDPLYPMNAEAATCFYTALFSDTQHFTTSSVNSEVLQVAQALVKFGALPYEIASYLTQRKPLSALRILEKALATLCLSADAKIATIWVTQKEIKATGATVPDMDGIVDYARSLATVEIALFVMELEEGMRISLRSKEIDILPLALFFGGGGHKLAAGFTLPASDFQETIDTILTKIHTLGLLNET
ncbi:MAG: hypothetical protein RL113_416 [Pseudomonadota bacterium]|jgi:phosphoesterase RecJ-like protein